MARGPPLPEAALKVWRRALPSPGVELSAVPLFGIVAAPGRPHAFLCEGAEPTFDLAPAEGFALPGGWVHFSGTCDRRGGDLFATLIAMDGAGCELRFPVPMTRAGTFSRVVELPARVASLRFSPLEGKGACTLERLVVTPLGAIERRARMLGWAAHDLWKFRGTDSCARAGLAWARLATDLEGAYAASGRLRAHPPKVPYAAEVAEEDAADEGEASRLLSRLGRDVPTVHVALRCEGAEVDVLEAAVAALEAQSYARWKVHPILTVRTAPEVLAFFRARAHNDARFLLPEPELCHGVALRQCLDGTAEGLFLLLDARVESLAPTALTFLASESLSHPDAAYFTSGEDRLGADGLRSSPYRKPAWNRELFEAQLRRGSLAAFRSSALRAHAGAVTALEGADGFALILALADAPGFSARVIPRTLAHRRSSPAEAERRESDEALEVLRAHHVRTGHADVRPGTVEGTAHVAYRVPSPAPKVTAIIPTRDAVEVLRRCVSTVRATTKESNVELLIVDNDSRAPETLSYLAELERSGTARVLRCPGAFNYSALNNRAVRASTGDLLAFLNNDLEATHAGWLMELVGHALRAEVGAVGAKLLYPDGFVQHAGVVVGLGGVADHVYRLFPGDHPGDGGRALVAQQYTAVTAACLVMRREVFESVGGFDEVNLPVAFNDVDLCLRLRERGLAVVWTPHACLVHHESYSRGNDRATRAKRRRAAAEMDYMRSRWGTAGYVDPFAGAPRTRGSR